ncbi:MAG: type II toxin-antitoxin system RelE/ParE family toxin [Dehalococcoidia bacterium]
MVFTRPARRELRKLPHEIQRRLGPHIEALSHEPRPAGVTKLNTSAGDEYRIRVGHYRVIYQIEDYALIVLVLRVGHRREVYR